MTALDSLPLFSLLLACVGVGAMLGPAATWRIGVALLAVSFAGAVLLWWLPSPLLVVYRPQALGWFALASVGLGATMRAALELGSAVRGPWVALLPLVGASISLVQMRAPALLEAGSANSLAIARATVGNEQQTRDLLLPIVQPLESWVAMLFVAAAAFTTILLWRRGRGLLAVVSAVWICAAAAVAVASKAVAPTVEAAETLARAALNPGEKLITLLPLPSGPFCFEPNLYLVLALVGLTGLVVASQSAAPVSPLLSGEAAVRGGLTAVLSFASLSAGQLAVGLGLGTMMGPAGLLLVVALICSAILLGTEAVSRGSARTLLGLLLLLPWLLWSSLGAPP